MTEQEQRHEEARNRFLNDPSKCYQRHIRELYESLEARPKIESLKGATVEAVTTEEAENVILKYEWLQTMSAGTRFCYGLKLNNELLGVACFNNGQNANARKIVNDPAKALKTICLCRGACVPHAPKDAGSFLVRHACRLAHRDFGYEIFFAYSDSAAGEIGTIYQAVGWKNLGTSTGRAGAKTHRVYTPLEGGKPMCFRRYRAYAVKHGWTKESGTTMRAFLEQLGCKSENEVDRNRWVWFEGKNRAALEADCRFPFLPYPKRKG